MPEKRRIFVGITASERIQDLAGDFALRYDRLPVRWLSGSDLHYTLVPPWEDDYMGIGYVGAKLQALAEKFHPITAELNELGFGPQGEPPRLISVAGQPNQELLDIFTAVNGALPAGTGRQFWLHLTLARFSPNSFGSFPQKKFNEKISWPETFDNLTLYESILTNEGSEYNIIKSYKFLAQ